MADRIIQFRANWELVAAKISLKNLGGFLLGNLIAFALGFGTTAYLVRVLGDVGFGRFNYAQTLAMYGALVVDLGLNAYGSRSVAREPLAANQILGNIASFQFILGILLLVISYAIIYLSPWWIDNSDSLLIMVSMLFVLPFAMNIEWFYLGLQRMNIVSVSKIIQYGSILLLTVLFVKNVTNIVAASLLRVVGCLLSALWLFYSLKSHVSLRVHVNFKEVIKYFSSSRWFWLTSIITQLFNGSDVIILHAFRSDREVGLYSSSFRLMGFITLAISLINSAMFPVLSTNSKDKDIFRHLLRFYLYVSLSVAFVILVLGANFSNYIIAQLYGKEYLDSVPTFRILLLAAAVLTVNGAIAVPLLAYGKESCITRQVAFTAVLYLGSNMVLIPRFGPNGAAWVYLGAVLFGTIWLIPTYKKEFF